MEHALQDSRSPSQLSRPGRMRILRATCLIVGGLAGFGSASAHAATTTSSFGVSATVQATCLIDTTNLTFGIYTGVQLDTTSAITVTCTNTTPYNVGLDAGVSAGATVTTRKMTGPTAQLLSYALFRDTGRTLNWGTTAVTDTAAGTGSGSAQPLTVYGRIASAQFVAPGAYTDTVTATITF